MTTTSAEVRRLHVLGQPGHGLDVEVVGRLVEHDEVVVAQQECGQRATPSLATGQPDDRAVQGHPGEQHLDDLAGAGVGGPLVVGHAAEHGLADRVGVVELVALLEEADEQSALLGDPAAVRLLEPGEHAQQGRLAVAVATDDADPLALGDAERDVVEEHPDAVRLRDPLEVQEVRHR